MQHHPVVSQDAWLSARRELLAKEKALTHAKDALNAERLALPWVLVEKDYTFATPDGPKTLAELFDGRSQLFVYHFMFGPDWTEGCTGCSFFADHIDGANLHLAHHDLTVVAVSRATLPQITAYKQRMGWRFPWVSSFGGDFNFDYHVSFTKEQLAAGKVEYNFDLIETKMDELPGASAFFKDETGAVFHTYSSYGRGGEHGIGAYMFLDFAPKGRNETGRGNLMDWVRRHDEYDPPTTRAQAAE
jgi:predicted dithiol-disulfide oxidoreductase (DUF899 family)